MSKAIRIGIVGCGFAADFHYNSYQRVTGLEVKVVGITSLTRERREKFACKCGINTFNSLEEILPEVDVIDICTPVYTHEEISMKSLEAGKHIIVEKPFTGYFGPPGDKNFKGNKFPKEEMLKEAIASTKRIITTALKYQRKICYAENWIYAPAVQKEAEIISKSRGQILWALGGQSHSGSLSPAYGIWRLSGGGSIVGKSCHPLSALLYLKQVEGIASNNRAIRPKTVSARTHEITRNPSFINKGFLRTDYEDIEDYGYLHVVFDDGMIADIFASELVMGGVHNWLEIFANNHRIRCNLSPTDALELYNPDEKQLGDVYIMEKIGTKQGWSNPAPDENFMFGYPQEIQDFMESIAGEREPKAGMLLASDVISVLYSAYVSAEKKGMEVEIPLIAPKEMI
ncbi:MAG: Gfo/Idh/MocA family oxidoreductase [Atribacterota bacterium]|nr:Gfo/Idh/MocA family oxidoreductase [Atribacterota bacterium]MDD5637757.1 Gfo/Idh/MocA family oxidoreductase [Atribacterota bacterium]